MSKRDLKKYLKELSQEQLQEQIIELYEKFTPVKVFYDFVFNPKEETLLQEAKLKISNEYFPIKVTRRGKAKMRRSVAQKTIKHFITLGVDVFKTADIMLYAIEIAQTYASENTIKQELFYKSMLNSFEQAITFCISNGIWTEFKPRIQAIVTETKQLRWKNSADFEAVYNKSIL
ncbi:DUF6155 family protein [Flavobacterium agrisoli]|uniref:Uncharacterized protein n=1 Tax=Flavobacterium agrisoli TaxID=2793066 RepID=A0A934PJG7_9FLAO|nr:DUF6155 family protein [Flavobacterium agrisoli]MBK0368514.1 hypothetical protein [Flavobacterium agrisoli]